MPSCNFARCFNKFFIKIFKISQLIKVNSSLIYSEDQGQRFHQDILRLKQPYQGQCNENIIGNHILGL